MPEEVVLPPHVRLLDMLNLEWRSIAIEAVAYHNLATIIGDETKTAKEIAAKAEIQEDWAFRVLRFLSSFGIFKECAPRTFCNTKLSACLCDDVPNSMRAMAMLMGSERIQRIWEGLKETMRTGVSVSEAVYGQGTYEYLSEHPEMQKIFNLAMANFSVVVNSAIASAYDFSGIKRLVDVGGGPGTLLVAILEKFSHLHGILFERPEVIKLATVGGKNIELVSGDFFKEVPSADGYILKEVLHNWPDHECIKILSNCVQASSSQGTILVCEQMITENKQGAGSFVRGLDLWMGLEHSGKERTEEEFRALFEKSGLYLARVLPTQSPHFILEGRLIG